MTAQRHKLFGEAAARYDLHTPPDHYQHDHQFVIGEIRRISAGASVLDVGCGTGVFLQRARAAGMAVEGVDLSPEMVSVAAARLGSGVARIAPMQELERAAEFNAVVSLCWSFHYCASADEAADVLSRFFRALTPGGLLVLQAAHAPNATGHLMEDWETGPDGRVKDVQFLYRFTSLESAEPRLLAHYVYACRSLNELVAEEHALSVADAHLVSTLVQRAGFTDVCLYDTWRRDPLASSVSPFVVARRPRG